MRFDRELYWSEFVRYADMATRQQALCNLGAEPYAGSVEDDLMCQVELYDVVERKYAGFSQLINDCFYGWTPEHPYWEKMQVGKISDQRRAIAPLWTGVRDRWSLDSWLYLFLVHRITGSGINYAKKPSGYNNTCLPGMYDCAGIDDMADHLHACSLQQPIFTSVGYQFPAFPKPPSREWKAGVYFMRVMMPHLARYVASYLESSRSIGDRPSFREVGELMFEWNRERGLKAYRFQYAAFLADVADWFPELIDRESPFYYGSNAVECVSYLTGGKKDVDSLDKKMTEFYELTGHVPYNAEDICCDFIRWVENYVRPGHDYDHVDRDRTWSSCVIKDHPFGRQRAMIDLGLIGSFNDLSVHPSDDYVISRAGLTVDQYQERVRDSGRDQG